MSAHVRPVVPATIAAEPDLDEAMVPGPRRHDVDATVYLAAVDGSPGGRTWPGST